MFGRWLGAIKYAAKEESFVAVSVPRPLKVFTALYVLTGIDLIQRPKFEFVLFLPGR